MCLILFALQAHSRYPLIVAANRDESYARPAAPAAFWTDHPHVYGGRDLEQGGTWLGLATNGRFAAVTNYRQGFRSGDAPRSRGELTRDYLAGTRNIAEYLEDIARRNAEYHGYSLIAGTPDRLFFCSNRGNGIEAISPGVHGLSNRLLDEPWPKVRRGTAVLSGLLKASESELTSALFDLLAERTPAPDHLLPSTGIAVQRERDLSAAFIPGESYGTRACTVVLVATDGSALFCERSFGPEGKLLGSTEQRFAVARDVRPAAQVAMGT
jgi:uncharacterized protein with NRDE domain